MIDKPLFAVVLAAGTASRFGATKQVARFDHEPLVRRAVRAAESVCGEHTLLVAGHDWREVAAACQPLRGYLAINTDFSSGLATSIVTAVRAVRECASGVLLILADQPLVTAAHLADLVRAFRAAPDSIQVTAYAGTEGPPVIFPASVFSQLLELRGDRGAKPVIEANREKVASIVFEDAAVDIDTESDLENLRRDPGY